MPIDKITLASGSPRRRDLLTDAGLRFEVCPADVEEFDDPLAEPSALVHHNARLKAATIADQQPEALVLGSDTTVSLHGYSLGKPADMQEARKTLKKLSGQTHTVYTGVALICRATGLDDVFVETSDVTFHELDEDTITQYFSIVNPLDKAGAYGIQDGRSLIIKEFHGTIENIMGLPIHSLLEKLEKLGLLDALRV